MADVDNDNSPSDEYTVIRARTLWHREGEIEVDPNAVVSRGNDNGAYVQAWVWVPDPTCAECGEAPCSEFCGACDYA